MHKHLIVWLDHKQASVFHVHGGEVHEARLGAPQHIHHQPLTGPMGAKEHPEDAQRFYHEIARSAEGAGEVLVVGPSTSKLDFIRYAHKHDPALESRIVGIETVGRPTDGQLVAYAKMYFDGDN